jgi:hypothetical protein
MDLYQHTVSDLTEYDPFLDPANYMYNGMIGMGGYMNHARRSNSRSGYRLFARVSNSMNRAMSGGTAAQSTRMPSRESVYMFFSQFGAVMDCYLPESATNVAYLCFEDEDTMELILQLPAHILCIEGVYITLSRASPRPDYSMNNTDRVFVKNCPDNINRTDLRNYFQQFGLVTDVYIPKDRLTGEQKKFAFVTFANIDSARAAISFGDVHRLIYIDRLTNAITTAPLQVMPAEARPSNTASNSGSTSGTGTPVLGPVVDMGGYTKYNTMIGEYTPSEAFTTASSTVATNTPTSALSVEAAASVLINALSQLDSLVGTTTPPPVAAPPQSEIDDILAKLSSISIAERGTPTEELQHELEQIHSLSCTPHAQTVAPVPADESISRQSSLATDVNIFEQFLNPCWEQRE